MAKEAHDVLCRFVILWDVEEYEAEARVPPVPPEVVSVEAEERRAATTSKGVDDFVVLIALREEVHADLPRSQASLAERGALPLGEVLIEDDHAGTAATAKSAALARK
jgi:hypothetical protein